MHSKTYDKKWKRENHFEMTRIDGWPRTRKGNEELAF